MPPCRRLRRLFVACTTHPSMSYSSSDSSDTSAWYMSDILVGRADRFLMCMICMICTRIYLIYLICRICRIYLIYLICLICLICLIYLIYLICLISLICLIYLICLQTLPYNTHDNTRPRAIFVISFSSQTTSGASIYWNVSAIYIYICLLYTSDAADE